MSTSSDISSILDRIANGTHTDADLAALRRAIEAGSIKVEGDVTDSVIITGHGNKVEVGIEKGTSLNSLRVLLQEFLPQREPEPEYDDIRQYPLIRAYLKEVADAPIEMLRAGPYVSRQVSKSEQDWFSRFIIPYSSKRGGTSDRQGKSLPIENLIGSNIQAIILGEPGLGKTTSLQHLAKKSAQNVFESDGLIPIFVELKYYQGESLECFLAEQVDKKWLLGSEYKLGTSIEERTNRLFKWFTLSGDNFILFLDGLNEVPIIYHAQIRSQIAFWSKNIPNLIISCRERDYDFSISKEFSIYKLDYLKPEQIRTYFSIALGFKGGHLFRYSIQNDRQLLTLASIPIMLWIMVQIIQKDPDIQLPSNFGKLFQEFINQLRFTRLQEGIHEKVSFDVVEVTLSKLSYEMRSRDLFIVSLSEVRKWDIPTYGYLLEDILFQAKDWRLLKSDGFSSGYVEFIHQLYLEYFTAVFLRDEFDDELILGEKIFSSEWTWIIVMLAGLIHNPGELLEWIFSGLELLLSDNTYVDHTNYPDIRERTLHYIELKRKIKWLPLLLLYCWEASEAKGDAKSTRLVAKALITRLENVNNLHKLETGFDLKKLGDEGINILINALYDSDPDTRRSAAMAMGAFRRDPRIIQPLISAMHDSNAHVRKEAKKTFEGVYGSSSTIQLVNAFINSSHDVKIQLISRLGKNGDSQSIEFLLSLLNDSNLQIRKNAVIALGKIGDRRATQPLIESLHDPSGRVRRSAIRSLKEIRDPLALPHLESILINEIDTEYFFHLSKDLKKAIKEIKNLERLPNGTVDLIFALRSKDWKIRNDASKKLVSLGKENPNVVASLVGMLTVSDYHFQNKVEYTIEEIGDAAVEIIISMMDTRNLEFKKKLILLLGSIGTPNALHKLENLNQDDLSKDVIETIEQAIKFSQYRS